MDVGRIFIGEPLQPTPVPTPAANPIEAMEQFQDEMIRLCEMYSRKIEEHATQRDKFAELYQQATNACDAISKVLRPYRDLPDEKAAY